MKVGYAILYEDGTLTISKEHTILQKPIYKDYDEFDDTDIPWKNDHTEIKIVRIIGQVKSNDMSAWFEDCYNLTTLYNMFRDCYSLIDDPILNTWNVSNVKYFNGMFHYCYSLKKIHLPNTLESLNYQMFMGCNPMLQIHWKDKIYIYDDLKEYQEF